ncbi:MAG: non-canonical purine NTP pyrophosphatase, partial [bacterium]|nr:non-canonical purine NTP pyrophosphatase [bacterium]
MQLFFASSNRDKIKELQNILAKEQLPLQLFTLLDHPEWEMEIEENGQTYAENALLKAQAYQKLTNLPILADDSGLEVDVLPGLLGVYTNRWHPGDAKEKNLALLKKLGDEKNRCCHYNCTLCLLEKGRAPIFFVGLCQGQIADQISHEYGFGYDPI